MTAISHGNNDLNLSRVDYCLIDGYESKHPGTGSLKDQSKEIKVLLRREWLLRWLLVGVGFSTVALLILKTVPDSLEMGGSVVSTSAAAVGLLMLIGAAYFVGNHYSRLVSRRFNIQAKLDLFREKLGQLDPFEESQILAKCNFWFYHEAHVSITLVELAKSVLLKKAAFKALCQNVEHQTEHEIVLSGLAVEEAEQMFEQVFETAVSEFDLKLNKRKLFEEARNCLDKIA